MRDNKSNNPVHEQGKHASHGQGSTKQMKPASKSTSAKGSSREGTGAQGTAPVAYGTVPDSPMLKKKKKRALIVVGVVVALLAAIYGGGALFFSSHFFPNTILNNEDLSLQPSEVLADRIQAQADSYSLTIEGKGFSYSFNQGETAIDIDPHKIAEDTTKAQDIALWPIEVFSQHDISDVVIASYDEAGFADVLNQQIATFNESQTPSANASVIYDEDAGIFSLKPEVYGTQIDVEKLIAKAGEAIKSMRSECEVTQDDLVKPTVLAADPRTLSALKKVGEMFPNEVTLTLNGSVNAATIDKATFASWVYIDPADYTPKINQEPLTAWVDEKASGMNTIGTTRTWTREDGKVCTVSGGTYGWKADTSTLATTVYDALNAGGATTVDIPCSQSGAVYNGVGARDWGAYVDVDLSEQTARYYDASGNLLHSCGIVSGLPTADRATPRGVYYLNAKQSPSTLVGYKPNGEIDYETPVKYWMPFVGNSVGLHDATWQASFGGTRYKTNGSHGCVNLSLADAQWFYENLSTGVCVITHD